MKGWNDFVGKLTSYKFFGAIFEENSLPLKIPGK